MAPAHVDFKVFQRKLINFVILAVWFYVGSFKNWCDRESNEMLVLIFNFKAKKKKWFSQFLCTERQQTGLQNIQICVWGGGLCPPVPPSRALPLYPTGALAAPGPWPFRLSQYSPSTFSNSHAWYIKFKKEGGGGKGKGNKKKVLMLLWLCCQVTALLGTFSVPLLRD